MIQSAQVIIWVMVGGVGTLFGPILGSIAISWLTLEVGTQHLVNANLLFGAIMLVFVLLVPRGLLPMWTEKVWARVLRPRGRIAMRITFAAPRGHA
jgi:branched-chain amino acid transport system permease protein